MPEMIGTRKRLSSSILFDDAGDCQESARTAFRIERCANEP